MMTKTSVMTVRDVVGGAVTSGRLGSGMPEARVLVTPRNTTAHTGRCSGFTVPPGSVSMPGSSNSPKCSSSSPRSTVASTAPNAVRRTARRDSRGMTGPAGEMTTVRPANNSGSFGATVVEVDVLVDVLVDVDVLVEVDDEVGDVLVDVVVDSERVVAGEAAVDVEIAGTAVVVGSASGTPVMVTVAAGGCPGALAGIFAGGSSATRDADDVGLVANQTVAAPPTTTTPRPTPMVRRALAIGSERRATPSTIGATPPPTR
jgi:hypothetical protein